MSPKAILARVEDYFSKEAELGARLRLFTQVYTSIGFPILLALVVKLFGDQLFSGSPSGLLWGVLIILVLFQGFGLYYLVVATRGAPSYYDFAQLKQQLSHADAEKARLSAKLKRALFMGHTLKYATVALENLSRGSEERLERIRFSPV